MFILGVSSGYFGVARPEEKRELLGLFKKAQSSITKGVKFVQLDLESISEFEEPGLVEKMKRDIVEKLGVSYGIHSETRAVGVEAAELDSSIRIEYERGHNRIADILRKAEEIGCKYVLIHASESTPFPLLGRTLQPTDLVDPEGRPLRDFLLNHPELLEWLMGGKKEIVRECILKAWKEKKVRVTSDDISYAFKEKGIKPQDFIWVEFFGGGRKFSEVVRGWIIRRVEGEEMAIGKKYEQMPKELQERVDGGVERTIEIELETIHRFVMSFIQSGSLQYGPERLAYYFIAKWMEMSKDPLWEGIVRANIEFFARKEKKSLEEWTGERGIDLTNLSIDDEKFRNAHEIWVPAVSAKYIYGHFFPSKGYVDLKQYLRRMFFALESPMGGRGIEEWMRFANPIQFYYLAERINADAGWDVVAVALDFEHMLSSRIDPKLIASLLPENGGRHVRVIHTGWPSVLAPAHLGIEIGSEQQKYLYEVFYDLMKKGCGVLSDCFIIFERGDPETFQQTIVALRLVLRFLEKGVPPGKLPPEFYGISPKEVISEERQLAVIRKHFFDPLKGTLEVPEERFTFLARKAIEKGKKPEEWEKEEFR